MNQGVIAKSLLISVFFALAPRATSQQVPAPPKTNRLEPIRIEGRAFVLSNSGRKFVPWGFNYDHDAANRLLETYWDKEWDDVASDFNEMKELGANTVRIHLQMARFMTSETNLNSTSFEQLGRLVKLAEETRLYLDVTGLGCYDKMEVPKWYNALTEEERWEVQARFWEAVAKVCSESPAIFCYDLMNEPVLTEDKKGGGQERP
jgi:aryl-phospho-beta-D-glucosidase BglC (GH1 family)